MSVDAKWGTIMGMSGDSNALMIEKLKGQEYGNTDDLRKKIEQLNRKAAHQGLGGLEDADQNKLQELHRQVGIQNLKREELESRANEARGRMLKKQQDFNNQDNFKKSIGDDGFDLAKVNEKMLKTFKDEHKKTRETIAENGNFE